MKVMMNAQAYQNRFPQKQSVLENNNLLQNNYSNNNSNNINFKGAKEPGKITKYFASILAKLAKSEKMSKFIDKMSQSKTDCIKVLSTATGLLISGLYMYNTAKSKTIEEDQKKPFIINQGLVGVVSAALGWTIDSKLEETCEKFAKQFKKVNKNMDDKTMGKCVDGIKTAKTLLVFTMIYRYLSPVVLTPVANKISNMIDDHKSAKKNVKIPDEKIAEHISNDKKETKTSKIA